MAAGELRHRILVVEDEAVVGLLLEDMVLDSGSEIIGPVARFEEALALAHTEEFDVAALDLNLNGTLDYPIAEVVCGRGIPIIFSTGYAGEELLDGFKDCPTLQKPFNQGDFAQAISVACDRSSLESRARR